MCANTLLDGSYQVTCAEAFLSTWYIKLLAAALQRSGALDWTLFELNILPPPARSYGSSICIDAKDGAWEDRLKRHITLMMLMIVPAPATLSEMYVLDLLSHDDVECVNEWDKFTDRMERPSTTVVRSCFSNSRYSLLSMTHLLVICNKPVPVKSPLVRSPGQTTAIVQGWLVINIYVLGVNIFFCSKVFNWWYNTNFPVVHSQCNQIV